MKGGEPHVPGLAVAAFTALALALVVFALPPAQGALLVPALLVFLLGVALLAFADGPKGARYAALLLAAYVVIVFGLFLASTSITFGKSRTLVNPDPPAFAAEALAYATDALPGVLVAGAGLALWPWSGRVGRACVVVAAVGVVAFVALTVADAGGDTAAEAARAAATLATLAQAGLSVAAVAVIAAIVLAVGRDRLPWDVS